MNGKSHYPKLQSKENKIHLIIQKRKITLYFDPTPNLEFEEYVKKILIQNRLKNTLK